MAEDPRSILERNKRLLADRAKTQESEELLEKLPQGHGSGLNADMVDGLHAAEIIARAPGKGGGGGGSGSGSGDMTKAVYDQNENGIVDNSEKLGGKTVAEVQDHAPKAHTHPCSELTDHNKAIHDALDVDADTVDGLHGADLATDVELASHAANENAHHTKFTTVEYDVTARHPLGTVVSHDALASLTEKDHANLTNVTADQHGDTKVKSKVVNETAIGDGKVLVYRVASDTLVYEAQAGGGGTPESILMGAMFMSLGGLDIYSVGGTVTKYSLGAKVETASASPYKGSLTINT